MKTEIYKLDRDFPEIEPIVRCAKLIQQGGVVIFPTETVYGLAADFNNPTAIKKLSELKKRQPDKPYTLMISQINDLNRYARLNSPLIYKVIDHFWPGPLTIVVPGLNDNTTVGLRMPDHAVALRFVQETGCPVAAPSANPESDPPPVTCDEALAYFDGLVDAALDGGPAVGGQGSTVVSLLDSKQPTIFREGAITLHQLESIMNKKNVLFVCTGNSCRSVMAEYYLRDLLKSREDVTVSSAGTSVFLHSAASSDTINVLKEEGIDARDHLSQPVSEVLLKKSDLILCMTRRHRDQVIKLSPDVENRTYLLREFTSMPSKLESDLDIPDPIGRSYQEYKNCFAVIKDAAHKVATLV